MPSTPRPLEFYVIPAGARASNCRGPNCQKRIYFVHNPATGAMTPVDADVEGGEAPSTTKDRGQLDAFSDKEAPVHDGRGVSHFATCPDAEYFRRARHD